MSRKFEYLRPKSGRKMLIGQFDQVMTYYTFHADLHGMILSHATSSRQALKT